MGNEFDELKDKMNEVKNNLENTGEETKGAVLLFLLYCFILSAFIWIGNVLLKEIKRT